MAKQAGLVRWLRPDFQRPRLMRAAAALREPGALFEPAPAIATLPPFPKDRLEQPFAIEQLLAASGRAMTVAEIAAGFQRRRNVEAQADRALQTLLRFGRVADLGNGRVAAAARGSRPLAA